MPDEAAAAVGAEHDEACFALLGGLDDPFPGRCCVDCDALRLEPGLLRQRCSVCGGLLRGLLHLGRVLGVEVSVVDGYDPTSAACQTQRTSAVRPGVSGS